jgi:hypothetical protein
VLETIVRLNDWATLHRLVGALELNAIRSLLEPFGEVGPALLGRALAAATLRVDELDGIAFSQGPGLGPCLRVAAIGRFRRYRGSAMQEDCGERERGSAYQDLLGGK